MNTQNMAKFTSFNERDLTDDESIMFSPKTFWERVEFGFKQFLDGD